MDHKDFDEEDPHLLFISTEPSTGKKPPGVRQVANRHVQNYYQHQRKQAVAKRLSTKGPIPFLRREQQSTPSPGSPNDDDSTHIEASTNIPGVGSSLANVANSSALIRRHRSRPGIRQSNSPSSPRGVFDTAELDPFAGSAVPLTLSMNRVFHHFLKITVPMVFPHVNQDAAFKQWFVQLSFGAPQVLFAVITVAAADISVRRGLVGPQTSERSRQQALSPSMWELFLYKTKAIRLLNQNMAVKSEATAVSIVYTVVCLLTVNLILGEQNEIAIHVKGLEKLIAIRGGLHGIPFAIAENILGVLYSSLAVAGSLPRVCSTPTLQTMPLSAQETIMSMVDPDLRETGSAILDDAFVSKLLSPKLQQNFSDRREALFIRECFHSIQRSRPALEPEPELEYYMLRRHQLRCEALSAPDDDMSSDIAVSPAEETCHLALLTFLLATYFPSPAILRRLSMALKTAVECSYAEHPSFWELYPKLLMWVLFLGAYISASPSSSSAVTVAGAGDEDGQGDKEGEVRSWFTFHLRRVAKDELCLSRWEEVREILKRHFYIDRVYRRRLMEIWEEVVSG